MNKLYESIMLTYVKWELWKMDRFDELNDILKGLMENGK